MGIEGRRIGGAALFVAIAAAGVEAAAKTTYDEHAKPIFLQNCGSCHNADRRSGGLNLTSCADALAGGSSGEVLAPGDLGGSRLYALVTHAGEPKMPPNQPKLADPILDTLRQWIEGGCLENAGSTARAAKKPKLDLAVGTIAIGRPAGPPIMPETFPLGPVVESPRPGAVVALAAHPWSPCLAIGGQRQVLLYDTREPELLGVAPFEGGFPAVVGFSRSGRLVFAGGGRGGQSGTVKVWSVTTGELVAQVGDEFDTVLAADLNPEQSLVALGGPSKIVKIHSIATGGLLHRITKHTDWIAAVAFSPDGLLLATADRAGGLHVWETEGMLPFLTLGGHKQAVRGMSWRADGNVLATCGEDGAIKLWEMKDGNEVKSWGAHGGGAMAVRFADDGRLVSAGRDGRVKLWDQNGKELRTFEPFPDLALACAFDSEGKRVIAGDFTGLVRVFDASDGKQVGELSANPPPLAARIAEAEKRVAEEAERQAKARAEAEAKVAAARDALEKANQELVLAVAPLAAAQARAVRLRAGDVAIKIAEAKAALDARRAEAKPLAEAADLAKLEAASVASRLEAARKELAELPERLAARSVAVEAARQAHADAKQKSDAAAAAVGAKGTLAAAAAQLAAQAQAAAERAPSDSGAVEAAKKSAEAAALIDAGLAEAKKGAAQAAEGLEDAAFTLEAAGDGVTEIEKRRQDLPGTIAALEGELGAATAKAAAAQAALAKAREPAQALEADLAKLEEAYRELRAKTQTR